MNNVSSQAIRSFSPNAVAVGYKIIIEPFKPIWLPVVKSKYSFQDYNVWLSDENGNIVNFNGETISITLWLRSVYSIWSFAPEQHSCDFYYYKWL